MAPLSAKTALQPVYTDAVSRGTVATNHPDQIQLDAQTGGSLLSWSTPTSLATIKGIQPGLHDDTNSAIEWNLVEISGVTYMLTLAIYTVGKGLQTSGTDQSSVIIGMFQLDSEGAFVSTMKGQTNVSIFLFGPGVHSTSIQKVFYSESPFITVPFSDLASLGITSTSKTIKLFCAFDLSVSVRTELKLAIPSRLALPTLTSGNLMSYTKVTDQDLITASLVPNAFTTTDSKSINALGVQWSLIKVDDIHDIQTKYVSSITLPSETERIYNGNWENESVQQLPESDKLTIPVGTNYIIAATVYTRSESFEIRSAAFTYDYSVESLQKGLLTQTLTGAELQLTGEVAPRTDDDEFAPKKVVVAVKKNGAVYYKTVVDYTTEPGRTAAYGSGTVFGGTEKKVMVDLPLSLGGWYENGTDFSPSNVFIPDPFTATDIDFKSAEIRVYVLNGKPRGTCRHPLSL